MIGTGRIHVYYGDGKGKTTAAMGLVLRAAGSGLDVLMFQFLKDNSSSERVILEQIPNVTCLPGKDRVKFVSKMNADEKARLKHYYDAHGNLICTENADGAIFKIEAL